MQPPRKVAEHRWVIDYDDVADESALIEYDPLTKILICLRCRRETCSHARGVRRSYPDLLYPS